MKKLCIYTLVGTIIISLLSGCNIDTVNNSTSSNTESSTFSQQSVETSQISDISDISNTVEQSLTTSETSETSEISEISDVSEIDESSVNNKVIDTSRIYNFDKKYFVNKLDDYMLKNFVQLYNAVLNFEKYVIFDISISSEELDTLMYLLNYDCPEIIHISGGYFPEYTPGGAVSAVAFDYIMSKEDYTENMKQLNEFFDNLKVSLNGMSDLEKEKYVYDFLFNNCIYNESELLSGSVCGVLLEGQGRCEAICKAFLWCMQEVDVECMALLGKPKWETYSLYENHSWNIIKIDGNYYHLDLTVDNLKRSYDETSSAAYGFFNVDTISMSKTHKINPVYENLGVPECTSTDKNYHKMNNLYIPESADLEGALDEILSANFNDGFNNVPIKFENREDFEYALENVYKYLPDILDNISSKRFIYSTTRNDLSQTILFNATPRT